MTWLDIIADGGPRLSFLNAPALHKLRAVLTLVHLARQAKHVPCFRGEVQLRFRRCQRVAVGPQRVEVQVGAEWTSDVRLIATVERFKRRNLPPTFSVIRA